VILYFTPGGRLGNQLFQYAFLSGLAQPAEICITTRMEQLLEVIHPALRIWNIPAGVLYRLIDRLLLPFVIRPMSRCGIFSVVSEDGQGELRRRAGVLSSVTLVEGYFQRQAFVPPGFRSKLKIRAAYLERAKNVLSLLPARAPKVCVHVRRTDYRDFSVLGVTDPSLPLSYYTQLLDRFRSLMRGPHFLFLSDDPDWVEQTFSFVRERYVSRDEAGVDFALMALCDGAIMSNSSLSWWGAFLMKPGSPRFCPRFWLGWKSGTWHPRGIEPSFAVSVEVTGS